MAIIKDLISTFTLGIGSNRAARVSLREPDMLGSYRIGAPTGGMTTIAAGAAIFSLRNISSNLIVIRSVSIGAVVTTAFTAAQQLQYGLGVARAFTASDVGGTAIAMTGNNGKMRSSLATPTSMDVRVSATAALSAGTKAVDANRIGNAGFWAGAVGATLATAPLFEQLSVGHPIVLAQNEGINVFNEILMGAGGVVSGFVNVNFFETASF